MRSVNIALQVLFLLKLSNAYKILIYSNLFGHSHIKFLASVANLLTDAGNDVTVVMPVIDVKQRNKTGLKPTTKQYFVEASEQVIKEHSKTDEFMESLWTEDTSNPINIFLNTGGLAALLGAQCNEVMGSTTLLEKLRAEKFDVAITEPFDLCAYGIFEYLQIPAHVSILVSNWMDHVSTVFGQPIVPSYVPSAQSVFSDRMTMWQRLINFLHYLSAKSVFEEVGDVESKNAKQILGIERSWRDILPESSFLLVNKIPILSFPAPTFDKIIPIGGIAVKKDRENMKLSRRWDEILSLRPKNVLISFGSNVKSMDMPNDIKQSFLNLFRSIPDATFIWKYENMSDTKFTKIIPNVHCEEWLPQNELLADPRLNLFVTHGGIGSVHELAVMGKPAVVVPMFADQARNAEMLKRHGGAVVLRKTDLKDSGLLKSTIQKVLSDFRFQENAEKLAQMISNQPMNASDTLIRHVEFAARFGKLPTMDPYGRRLSFLQYHLLDILGIAIGASIITIFIIFLIFQYSVSLNFEKIKSE